MFRELQFSVSRSVSACVSLAGFLYSRPSPFVAVCSVDHGFSCDSCRILWFSLGLPFENNFLGTVALFVLCWLGWRSRLCSSCVWLVSLTGLLLRPCPLPMSQFVRGIGSVFEILNFEILRLRRSVTRKTASVSLENLSQRLSIFVNRKWRARCSPLLGQSVHVVHPCCFGLAQLRAWSAVLEVFCSLPQLLSSLLRTVIFAPPHSGVQLVSKERKKKRERVSE